VLQTLPYLGVSSPGCFAYADMTTLGSPAPDAKHLTDPSFVKNCNGTRLSVEEARAQFAAFALLSSPLVLGFDVANASERALWGPIVTHPGTLAMNSAWDGEAGRLVARSQEEHTVPLAVGGICELMQNYTLPHWMVVGKRINSTSAVGEGGAGAGAGAGGVSATPTSSVFAAVLLAGDFGGPVDFVAPLSAMGFPTGATVHSKDGWSGEDTGDVTGQWSASGVAAPGGLYRVFYL
jgi:hypothetical protein